MNLDSSLKKLSTVCYFGSYDPNYSRNRIIIKGLNSHKVNVFECQAKGFFVQRFYNLTKKFLTNKSRFKIIIVGFPGWFDLQLAFLLAKIFRKKLIFDVFTPMYETYFIDRKQVRLGFLYLGLDKLNMKLADVVIADTNTHLTEYVENYGLNPRKGVVVCVGSDDDIFYPRKLTKKYDVLFYGSYQPLQGVEFIIKTAALLPNVNFYLIGNGQTRARTQKKVDDLKLKNITFENWVDLKVLAKKINQAKIVLGIFGNSQKANAVIPNKVYDGLACKKPIITKDSLASRELLSNTCYLVSSDDEKALANTIRKLMGNQKLRTKMANDGYSLFLEKFTPGKVVESLVDRL